MLHILYKKIIEREFEHFNLNEIKIPPLIIDACLVLKNFVSILSDVYQSITSFQVPVATVISSYFNNLKKDSLHSLTDDGVINLKKVVKDINNFIENMEPDRNSVTAWLDSQFKRFMNLVIYDYEYDFIKGYTIFNKDKFQVLLLRLEDFDRSLKLALSEFYGVDEVVIVNRNVSSDKYYAKQYEKIKNSINFNKSSLKRIYDHKFSRHFYTDKEIKRFINKWEK